MLKRMQLFIEQIKRYFHHHRVWLGWSLVGLIGLWSIPVIVYGGYLWFYHGRIFPGVEVAGLNLGGYKIEEARKVVDVLERDFISQGQIDLRFEPVVSTNSGELVYEVKFSKINLNYDAEASVKQAYDWGRGKAWDLSFAEQMEALFNKKVFGHVYGVNQNLVKEMVSDAAGLVDLPGAEASVSLNEESEVVVSAGEDGLVLDQEALYQRLIASFDMAEWDGEKVALVVENNRKSEDQVKAARERASKLVNSELVVKVESDDDLNWSLKDSDIFGFINFDGGFDTTKVENYVETLVEVINRDSQNANFLFDEGRVIEFSASKDGLVLDEEKSAVALISSLLELERQTTEIKQNEVSLLVHSIAADIETPDANDLGIETLLGVGESTFKGSIAGRVHNVALTASKLHGILIPPGEIFSFNGTIGDVSSATGYKTAYVIKDGRTVLGDGGGVCQDSTTLFRAALDAGLPIVERKSHSYRVSYYEQNTKPGYDATVFAPSVDLKFKNDTPSHILIQAKADIENLTLRIELYGTDDGRVAELKNYQQWDAVPAPPPLYQDDPTLAPGVVKQVDWASPGLKVKFDYVVNRDGETIFEKTYYSNYRPWQAVYLRGV